MKTTINIADELLARTKKLARQKETTLKAIIEAALQDFHAQIEATCNETPELYTHTVGGLGLRQGLSWDDWSEIQNMAYDYDKKGISQDR